MRIYFWLVLISVVMFVFVYGMSRSKTIDAFPETDYMVVEKKRRVLYLYNNGKLIKQYRVALGLSPVGRKEKEGDRKTPEGQYHIISKNPRSAYHLSLKISYPSEKDSRVARSKGLDPGGDIMIHGMKNGLGWIGKYHRLLDWTRGCIAVSNDEIQEIYASVKVGVVIEIKP